MFRNSVGYDRMQRLMDAAMARTEVSYPPYNIEADGEDAYRVTVAVAGFDKKDLDITLQNDTLSITGKKDDESQNVTYFHHGIAGRSRLSFTWRRETCTPHRHRPGAFD